MNLSLQADKAEAASARGLAEMAVASAFEAFIADADFPCAGAKASLATHRLTFLDATDLADAADDERIVAALQAFGAKHHDTVFASFAVAFHASPPLSEHEFETLLWQRLGALHAIDRCRYAWDADVSSDPASAQFSMSVGGNAFYVIGLHPGASRPARRFTCPVLVFNLHRQFEQLRADGRYEKLRRSIMHRDAALAGSTNPMLAEHGNDTEARQYSGRVVGPEWKCPCHFGPQASS